MLTTVFTLFAAGVLTILLPCVLPLVPIVLGVSIVDRSKWRPLVTIMGMVASFVGFTFLLQILLSRFVELADIIRLATYVILLLFGFGFLTHRRAILWLGAVIGGFFFLGKGAAAVATAAALGVIAVEIGGRIAARVQQLGADLQQQTREGIGASHQLLAAFLIGATMGLVWVPCAGPALGFALTLVRERPGLEALALLAAYGIGAGVPLLAIGYGGQWAVQSVRTLAQYSGRIKQVSGVLLILSALAFQYGWFMDLQTWIVQHTRFGMFGTDLEEQLFQRDSSPSIVESGSSGPRPQTGMHSSGSLSSPTKGSPQVPAPTEKQDATLSSRSTTPVTVPSVLPRITRAPAFAGLGPWHNSEPFTLESLRASHGARERRGKVVLVDFWTYSCINCIRTLPYIQGYWEKYKDSPFVLVGVHTPEFIFEKSETNVAQAIKQHGLTYPIAQDNDFATWNAFSNRYWPAKYLIDAEGYIRYVHFGEGNYEETDEAIASLLAEIGAMSRTQNDHQDFGRPFEALNGRTSDKGSSDERSSSRSPDSEVRGPLSPETYLGSRSWPALGNAAGGPSTEVVRYKAPAMMELHTYSLAGEWQLVDDEYQVLRSDQGEIRMKFLGGEINLVLGTESGAPVSAEVFIDGKKTKTMTVDHHDLYTLFKGEYGEHEMILKIRGGGLEGYAFTFGG